MSLLKFLTFFLWGNSIARTIYLIIGDYISCGVLLWWFTSWDFRMVLEISFLLTIMSGLLFIFFTGLIRTWGRKWNEFL